MQTATTSLTNSAVFMHKVQLVTCQCKVAHNVIKGAERHVRLSKHAQVYPDMLCSSIAACCAEECGILS